MKTTRLGALIMALPILAAASFAHDEAIHRAFRRHASASTGTASPAQLRRILRELGTDVSPATSRRLARLYGGGARGGGEARASLAVLLLVGVRCDHFCCTVAASV